MTVNKPLTRLVLSKLTCVENNTLKVFCHSFKQFALPILAFNQTPIRICYNIPILVTNFGFNGCLTNGNYDLGCSGSHKTS